MSHPPPRLHHPQHLRHLRFPLLAGVVLLATAGTQAGFEPERPGLIVLLTVDQLRPDYFTRWRSEWRGGFRGLMENGAVFLNGLQDHALTETAAGHSTLLSGRDPAHTGVALNERGVSDPDAPTLGFPDRYGASPHRFLGTTLVDWIRSDDPGFRFLSLAGKDRSAILPIGRSRGPVFWYVEGRFTTSRYYMDALPRWVEEWNAREGAARLTGSTWDLLEPAARYAEVDSAPWESGGSDLVFPHHLPDDPPGAVDELRYRPWLDSLTLDLALDGARNLGLGHRSRPDLLVVSLSATDYIGHRWGPDSREIHDHLLRLDRWLGWFLDSLTASVPAERLLVVLTADHGVVSFPERTRALGQPGGRIPLASLVREVDAALIRQTGKSPQLFTAAGLIYGDTARLREIGVSPESLATALAPRVWKLPGVVNAWTPATLGAALPGDKHAVRWKRALPANLAWLVCAVARPGFTWSERTGGTDHGTTNDDDVGVPVIFMGPGVRPGIYSDTVRTTDIAPTLARLLGVTPRQKLDGRPIKRLVP